MESKGIWSIELFSIVIFQPEHEKEKKKKNNQHKREESIGKDATLSVLDQNHCLVKTEDIISKSQSMKRVQTPYLL